MWLALIRHELKMRLANMADWLYPLVFFTMVLSLFPIAFGSQQVQLAGIATPMVWIALVFSVLLGVNRIFQTDMENGMLEQLLVARVSLTLWVMMRVGVFWLVCCGLLMLVSMLLVPMYGVSWENMKITLLTLLIGSPTVVLFSAFATALTGQQQASGVLTPVFALPLQLPVIIFSVGLVTIYQSGMNILPTVALLLAIMLVSIMLIPWAIATVLRMSV